MKRATSRREFVVAALAAGVGLTVGLAFSKSGARPYACELGHTDLAGLLIVPVDDSAHRVILYAETPKASGT